MTNDAWARAGTRQASRAALTRPGRPPPPSRRPLPLNRRPASGRPAQWSTVLVVTGALVLMGLAVAWMGQRAVASARPTVAWVLSPASDTVTVRLTSRAGLAMDQVLAQSRFAVSDGNGHQMGRARYGGTVRVHVPPGGKRRLLVQVMGPRAYRTTLTVPVPALREVPLYSFASPARRAIYITVDDGWTPSMAVLDLMRETHLPVTAFLIEEAAQRNLAYWRAFVRAGGTVGDHTVSHPNLTRLSLRQDTTQWARARRVLGRWLGRAPLMGRPPYGAFDPAVEAAAYRSGLKKLVGWSAYVDSDGIRTWDGKPLEPGEIVLLHWVPGLGHQLTKLLAAIRARHLNPMPLTPASFAGVAPQRHSLDGD